MTHHNDPNMVVSLRPNEQRETPPTPPPASPPRLEHRPPVRYDHIPLLKRWKSALTWGVGALVVILGIYGAWVRFAPSSGNPASAVASAVASSSPATTHTSAGAQRISDVIAKVGKLIELPANETPTVATVTDPSKLAGQAFFANAQAGDIVLLYTVAKKAYLYDPSKNILVDGAPITTSSTSVQ